ncbi:MAG: hypothetical protein EOP38_19630 [Rubrivivax sp.]|nr:MAG: hypothetical protein EOP38_19630 [Rubrivivax sp.]
MKTVYNAANHLEAHMLADLLKQVGITAHVRGTHLQGAMGELPAAGLIRLEVDEADHDAARAIIERWEATNPDGDTSPRTAQTQKSSRLGPVLMGLLAGVAGTYLFTRAPIKSNDGIDHDGDGQLDEKWYFSASGQALKTEIDRNFDGKVDYIALLNERGEVKEASSDDDFNGSLETRMHFKRGNAELAEVDTDGDGRADLRTLYEHGVAQTNDYLNPASQVPLRTEHLALGRVVSAEIDMDGDGTLDTREFYAADGRLSKREAMGL